MFALVDCNNFYASCQRVFRPDLNGKPIVVLSNNDGCVIARSDEAKAAGIPMGAPAFKYQKQFEQQQIEVFSANFPLYGDMSNRVMSILGEFSPDMEVYSIDECFLRLDGFEQFSLQTYGMEMRKKVRKGTGIPVSVGIAPTKALAKVANRIARKYPDITQGSYVIDTEEKRIYALKWLAVEDVWGIGRRLSKHLKKIGVLTAYDFTQLSDAYVRKHFSVVGLRLKHDLQGIPTLDLEVAQPKKNIAITRSFERPYASFEDLLERITTFTMICAEKLRAQNSCCGSLIVFIHTNGFRKDLPQYNRSFAMQLPFPTNSSLELTQFAEKALRQIYKEGYYYKKAGVIVQDFTSQAQLQGNLFFASDQRHQPLMRTIDLLNARFGQQKIRLGGQDLQRIWKMNQYKLSPSYTTNLSEVILVSV